VSHQVVVVGPKQRHLSVVHARGTVLMGAGHAIDSRPQAGHGSALQVHGAVKFAARRGVGTPTPALEVG